MYQQLQLQAQAQSQAHSQAHASSPPHTQSPPHAQSPSQPRPAMMFPSQSPSVQNIIVSSRSPQQQPHPQHQSVSPATSVRSVASLHLGQVQTDPNGNQGMNI